VRVYDDSTYTTSSDYTLKNDMGFDPYADGGPRAPYSDTVPLPSGYSAFSELAGYWGNAFDPSYHPVDWTHVNSVSAFDLSGNERITLSSREWSEIIRFDPNADSVLWTLNGNDPSGYGGFTILNDTGITGPLNFYGQHDVTTHQGDLLLFDNRMNGTTSSAGARAIRVSVDTTSMQATIEKNWTMRKPTSHDLMTCDRFGSATIVPTTEGNNVLVDCGPKTTIEELGVAPLDLIDQSNGSVTEDPFLYIHLDDDATDGWDFCTTAADPTGMFPPQFWYRAWPMLGFGEF